MPTWRIRTEGVPTTRKAYGGNVATNAGAYAPGAVVNATQYSGGCEQTWGAPRRLVPIDEAQGHGANYLPTEQQPGKWAPALAANDSYVTLTFPSRVTPKSHRANHIPPVMPTPNTVASNVIEHNQGARPKVPRAIVTPTPQPRLVFRQYGA